MSIGENTIIFNGARIECISEWNGKEFIPRITIDDCVNIGQNVHITCANSIKIGKKVSIMPSVLITDIEHEYIMDKSLEETELKVGNVEIGDYSMIGAGTKIFGEKGIVIGKNVIIGANSIIKKSIPDNSIAYGNPIIIKKRNI